MKQALVLLLASAATLPLQPSNAHVCVHDTLSSGQSRMFVRSPQHYANTEPEPLSHPAPKLHRPTKRQTQTSIQSEQRYATSTFAPIRITTFYDYLNTRLASKPTLLSYIKLNLMPRAVEWFADTLSVKPVQGNLFLSRQCSKRATSNGQSICTESMQATCGPNLVNPDHYGSFRTCVSSTTVCLLFYMNLFFVMFLTLTNYSCQPTPVQHSSRRDWNSQLRHSGLRLC
jgi:hypothetical protein